jgi:segregation and condensation protein A
MELNEMEEMEQPELPLRVKLEVFEGPLDLLLHLIKKNEIDIYDIPITMITAVSGILGGDESLNLDIADFLLMAATLLHIKSALLPPRGRLAEENAEAEEDPRAELVRRLLGTSGSGRSQDEPS